MNIQESALVLIDLQKESNFSLQHMDRVIGNSRQLIEACKTAGIPVIYTRQINRADGIGLSKGEPLNDDSTPFYYASNTSQIEIFEDIKPQENDIVIDKYRWSAFYETSLDLILKSLNVRHLIIGGVVTDGCLMTTVFDAYFRDYDIHLIQDICSASNEGAHMASLMIMANWIYHLSIYDTENFIKFLNGEAFINWESTAADTLQFTPENMREVFSSIQQPRKDGR
ncbi:Nicotinamidase-related amidase [Lentibacillus halodurans]|uniref:Nicotinamidase-related amidase n=1 Tax=Lentibacillus halodurans TaxID=237679 RepID=A0A1I1A8L7_9BACI|nr:isochorismatase family cysteine hydrolase [Lentibacillus halodurans]SFB32753.1 Nicotinamidase-related amidase [Lentibacillus halodurans]